MRAVLIATASALLLGPVPTDGQGPPVQERRLRSFAAIRSIELAPALPGTERVHADFARQLASLERYGAWGPPRATCTLRTDLQRPKALGLECYDETGAYVGGLRAKRTSELQRMVVDVCLGGFPNVRGLPVAAPEALPLSEYRYLYVVPTLLGETSEYATRLLQADGFWKLISRRDAVPPPEADRLLVCSARVWKKQFDFGSVALLELYDSEAHTVREIRGESDWSGANGALRAAVSRLVEERRLDEEIHRPLRSTASRPAKRPRP